jgi:uncharacterized protein YjbJ (UPF0337 family)
MTVRRTPSREDTNFKEFYMNKDQVKGRIEQAKGKAKEIVGKMTGKKTLEVKGDADQVTGRVQKTYGNAKSQARKTK